MSYCCWVAFSLNDFYLWLCILWLSTSIWCFSKSYLHKRFYIYFSIKLLRNHLLWQKKIPKVSFSEIHYLTYYVFVLYIITLMQEHSNFYFPYFIWIYFWEQFFTTKHCIYDIIRLNLYVNFSFNFFAIN